MDINEFMAKVQPGKKISKLQQYEKEIRQLKANGYTDDQIRIWLSENNVIVSREAVRQFVKKHAKGEIQNTAAPKTESATEAPKATSDETNAQRLQRRLAEQKEQADNTRFKHDKSGNH